MFILILALLSFCQSTDLWEGLKGPFLNVINCIHSLGYLASNADFTNVVVSWADWMLIVL